MCARLARQGALQGVLETQSPNSDRMRGRLGLVLAEEVELAAGKEVLHLVLRDVEGYGELGH